MEGLANVSTGRCCTALELWLGWLAALIDLNDAFQQLMTLRSALHYLQTGEDCLLQCGHYDFQSSKDNPSGYFVILTASEGSRPYVFGGSNKYVFIPEMARKLLLNALKLEEISIFPSFVVFGYGYRQRAYPGWRRTHHLPYHTYFIPVQKDLKNAILFAC